MAKRRLSQQQLRRISSSQHQRGKRAKTAAERADEPLSHDELGPEQAGLVVCHYGQQLDIESLESSSEGQIHRCYQRSNLPPLVTGDRVIWQPAAEQQAGVVVALQPRSAVLSRPNAHGELRPVAANIDTVVVVLAPAPEPFANLIDRYLVAVENLGLQCLLLLNKVDLLDDSNRERIETLLQTYHDIGYPVLHTSCTSSDGLDTLRQQLSDRTAVFVGQSGVGKSSLINALRQQAGIEEDMAAVGALSIGREKGTHTTTATRLYHLPGSGDLIDSPGIREFGLTQLPPAAIADGFVEFRPFLGHCRFRDCSHQQEPGCALLQAVSDGQISAQRLDSYFHILREL